MRVFGRILTVIGIIVLLVAVGAAGTLWLTLPPAHQHVHIAGLSAPVDISFDQDGVPRIRAASELDAAAALGLLNSFAAFATTASIAQVIAFVVIVIFLQVRPQGLFTVRARSLV